MYAYTGASPTATGQVVTGQSNVVAVVSKPTTSSMAPPKPSSSSNTHNVPAVPTPPHSSTLHLPTVAPPAAAHSSSSDPDSQGNCGSPPKRRGLDYHRHHRRLSYVPALHNHDFFHDNYWIPRSFQFLFIYVAFCYIFLSCLWCWIFCDLFFFGFEFLGFPYFLSRFFFRPLFLGWIYIYICTCRYISSPFFSP